MSYVSTFDNRHYVALEEQFGSPLPGDMQRIPLVSMELTHSHELPKRRDKTGSRSFAGNLTSVREAAQFVLKSYLYDNPDFPSLPPHALLLQAALGGDARVFDGAIIDSAITPVLLRFQAQVTLTVGQAVAFAGELRFVIDLPDAYTVEINAPFSVLPSTGSAVGPATTFTLGSSVTSVSLFDYWGAGNAVNRIVSGAVIDSMRITINGDFHELEFQGPAARLLDSATFDPGAAGLSAFPDEPVEAPQRTTPVPGHLGQVWLGIAPTRLYSLTEASLRLVNHVAMRNREFGSTSARLAVPGSRTVSLRFALFEDDNPALGQLYSAARNRAGIPIMLQLGQQASQLMAVYMKTVVPQLPSFDESDSRLQFAFDSCSAEGIGDDELFLALG